MAEKNMTFSFQIAGKLAGNFKASFGEATRTIKNFQKAADLQTLTMQKSAAAYSKNIISAKTFANTTSQITTLQASRAAFESNIISAESYANVCKQLNFPLDGVAKTTNIVEKGSNKWERLKTSAKVAGASFVGLQRSVGALKTVLSFTDTASDFQHAMSKVGAITLGSIKDQEQYDAELAKLTYRARELGEKTQFSARQSAEAMSYLGMAGWNANQIYEQMPHLLDLAAAGGTDLARTADILSDDLSAFGLEVSDAKHMADVFATTITSTNTNIEMLGETFKYAAPVAHAFGASLEETAAMAGIMANSGIKASQAGTTLRSGFLRLAGPPKMAQKALDELGMTMEDLTAEQKEAAMAMKSLGIETGNLQGTEKMASILSQLRERMQDLSKEQKLAMAGSIFGKQAATGWVTMLDSAPGTLEKLTESLKHCDGAAAEMAKRMNADAKGAAIRLKSATESLEISIGSVLLPTLASWGDTAAKVAGEISKFASDHQGLTSTVTGVALGLTTLGIAGSALGVVVGGLSTIVTGLSLAYGKVSLAMKGYHIMANIAAAKTWLLNTALLANPIGATIVALVALAAACKFVYDHVDTIRDRWNKMWGEFKTSCPIIANVFETIASVLLAPYNLICSFVDKAKELLGLGPVKVESTGDFKRLDESSATSHRARNGRATLASVSKNASGGIYGKGAFLTTFAEKSGESAIPHTPTKRNIGLLAKTNQIMGNPLQPVVNVTPQFSPIINAKAETPAVNVQAPTVTMPNIPPATVAPEIRPVMATPKLPEVSPVFNPIINAMASAPFVTVPPAVVKQPAINVQQADMTIPAPVIRIPESKPILQAPPVVRNIIRTVADSPIVKTFVKAVAAVPDVIVNPASPVLKPIFTAMVKAPEITPVLRQVFNAVAPAVSPVIQATAATPNISPVFNPLFNVPKADTPPVKISQSIQAMAKTPAVTALFDPKVQTPALPDINVPQSTQKETFVERIRELVRPQGRSESQPQPINITFNPNIVINGNADRQEVEKATEISFQKLRELMEQLQREKRRVQYG